MNQIAGDVFMVRPRHFGPNDQTASSNAFQEPVSATDPYCASRALTEFDDAVERLAASGVRVIVGHDTHCPVKPDAVFPNNWVSFHEDGTVVLYPMAAANRRAEKRIELIHQVQRQGRFVVGRLLDLSYLEEQGAFLEGTGSLVIDRVNRTAYAALSSRTRPAALAEFSRQTGIEVISFDSSDEYGRPVYHTNVMMSVGRRFAVICAEAIANRQDRERIVEGLTRSDRRVVEITLAQMRSFAGNVLELATGTSRSVVVISTRAAAALTPAQSAAIEEYSDLLRIPLDTIERTGGGSIRCMLAELFLPRIAKSEQQYEPAQH